MRHFRYLMTALSLALTSILAMTAAPQTAQATSVISLTDEQLVQFSDYILHATILETEAVQFDEKTILTRVSVIVHDYIQSPNDEHPETFEFYTRGGAVGDMDQYVPGEFVPAKGAEVIVFLEKIKRYENRYMVLGLTQGAFVVDGVPMTRSDRKLSGRIARNREFVRIPTGFDAIQDVDVLIERIRETSQKMNKGRTK